VDWREQADAAIARYEGGETHDVDQRQLTQLANAAWAAGLCLLMAGDREGSARWLRQAAIRYGESWAIAPPDSWGRPIAGMKALLLAGADPRSTANFALEQGAGRAESPIGRYAAALALLVLERDEQAAEQAAWLQQAEGFPQDVAAALAALAARDAGAYAEAVESVLSSFEERDAFLEDVAVADTALVLEALARPRGLASGLRESPRLP